MHPMPQTTECTKFISALKYLQPDLGIKHNIKGWQTGCDGFLCVVVDYFERRRPMNASKVHTKLVVPQEILLPHQFPGARTRGPNLVPQ